MLFQKRARSDRQIVFFHVPKCGGISVSHVIRKANPGKTYASDSNDTLFEEYRDEELRGFGILAGHLGYGITERLRDPIKITFLRDPVDRALSMYYYWKSNLSNPDTDAQTRHGVRAFLRSDAPAVKQELDNGITWQFHSSRLLPSRERYRDLPMETILEQAIRNALTMDFVGFQESMTDDITAMCGKFGWRRPLLTPRKNTTLERKSVQETEPEVLSAIRETVHYDLLLYRALRKAWRG